MRTFRNPCLLLLIGVACLPGLACGSGQENLALKREQDRALIRLNRVESERDRLKDDLAKAKLDLAALQKTSATSRAADSTAADRAAKAEADLLTARRRIRELEEQVSAMRSNTPPPRTAQP